MRSTGTSTDRFEQCPAGEAQTARDQASPSTPVCRCAKQADDVSIAVDQTLRSSGRDQTSSDSDQNASDQDQTWSDQDEEASADDQDLLDRELIDGADRVAHELHRRARLRTSAARLLTAESRDRTAVERWQIGEDRDQLADESERRKESVRPNRYGWLSGNRRKAADDRARALEDRGQAGLDRAEALRLRAAAAFDRSEAVRERRLAGIDQLTGVCLRSIGLDAVERDIQRARRTGTTLALAFVDVNNLKRVNDSQGHLAGDMLLHSIAGTLQVKLRPYDTIMRFGGDEFVCALSDIEPEAVRRRFEAIIATLEASGITNPISFGLAELEATDDLESLIKRADDALIETRRSTGHWPVRT